MKEKYTSQQYVFETINPNKQFLQTAEEGLRSLSDGGRKVLSLFRDMGNYKRLYFRQTWIAEVTGLSRMQVNRLIKKLEQWGLIAKKYRHMNTSNYRVSDFILNPSSRIKKLLLLICVFSLSSLRSLGPAYPPYKSDVTHKRNNILGSNSNTKLNNYIYIYNSINGRSTAQPMTSFNKEDFIPPIVSSLKYLNLTWDQKFKLSAFPLNALSHAFTQLKYSNGSKNSYAWFKNLCEKFCVDKKIEPNWRLYYQLSDVYGKDEVKEEKKEVRQEPAPRVAYSYKLPESYLAIRKENPLSIFTKQYRFMLTQENSVIPQHALWEMGVARFVRTSFFGYLGERNMCPDLVLAHIDSLVESADYRTIVNEFGLEGAKKFIVLCLESVIEEQGYALNAMKMSYYGKNKLATETSTQMVLSDQIVYRTRNVDEFMRSDAYGYIAQVVGEDVMRKYVYQIVENWMKIMQ